MSEISIYSTFTKTSQMFLDIFSCSIYLNNPKKSKNVGDAGQRKRKRPLDKGKGQRKRKHPLLLTLFLFDVTEVLVVGWIFVSTENIKIVIIDCFSDIFLFQGTIPELLPQPYFSLAVLCPPWHVFSREISKISKIKSM